LNSNLFPEQRFKFGLNIFTCNSKHCAVILKNAEKIRKPENPDVIEKSRRIKHKRLK